MTAEEKRERLLKRCLPALVITVIYFVFVSGFISDEKIKSEEGLTKLTQKGVNAAVIPGMNKQIQQSKQQVSSLTTKLQEHQNKIKKMAGFIANNETNTETSRILAKILADNNLVVTQETSEPVDNNSLSPAIKEIKQWLQPNKDITAQQLSIRGSYFAMLTALTQINTLKLQLVPIVFNMTAVDESAEKVAGELKWELTLWM